MVISAKWVEYQDSKAWPGFLQLQVKSFKLLIHTPKVHSLNCFNGQLYSKQDKNFKCLKNFLLALLASLESGFLGVDLVVYEEDVASWLGQHWVALWRKAHQSFMPIPGMGSH